MNKNATLTRCTKMAGQALLVFGFVPLSALAQTGGREMIEVVRTNWTAAPLTNVVEISIPTNHIFTEYRTNWTRRPVTNVVDVTRTTWVPVTVTNLQTIEQFRTNWTTAYTTNWRTLTLTNWETVVQFKTNWTQASLTNVVELNTAPGSTTPAATATPPPAAAPVSIAPVSVSAGEGGVLTLSASKPPQPAGRIPVEVLLRVGLEGEPGSTLQATEWRVERTDGSVALFVREAEFKRALPTGNYRVEVRAQREPNGPQLIARRALDVTTQDVTLQPMPARQ